MRSRTPSAGLVPRCADLGREGRLEPPEDQPAVILQQPEAARAGIGSPAPPGRGRESAGAAETMSSVVDLTYAQAVSRAKLRMATHRLPIGVAVRRTWGDGPSDGIRAEIVIADGARVARPGSVLVFRAWEWVDIDALETELECYALRYMPGDLLRELALEIAEGSPALGMCLEQIWLTSRAA
jgi:hypothetical protein